MDDQKNCVVGQFKYNKCSNKWKCTENEYPYLNREDLDYAVLKTSSDTTQFPVL